MVKYCQNCKNFKNNPGWCKDKKDYTARKETCENFKPKGKIS